MSRIQASGGRVIGAAYGAGALVSACAMILPGWEPANPVLLAGLTVTAALVGLTLFVTSSGMPPSWLLHLCAGLGSVLAGIGMLAAGGGAPSATIAMFLVWIASASVVFLPRPGAYAQVALAALIQSGCLVALGDGRHAPARVAATVLIATLTGLAARAWMDRAARAAGTDALTGLPNRSAVTRLLDRELARADRAGHEVSVVCLDLDNLKAINDSDGHAAGDRALVDVAHCWSDELRTEDVLARVGGDEFVAVLVGTDEAKAGDVVRRLATATPEHLGASIGVATARTSLDGPTLLDQADTAMYEEKRRRRRAARAERSKRLRSASVTPGHDAVFILEDDTFITLLASRISAALEAGETFVVIATQPHRAALRSTLGDQLRIAEQTGRYLELDAEETLDHIAPDGRPDSTLINESMGNLLRGLTFDGRKVQAYGEMVGLLWSRENVQGAMALEDIWNDLRGLIDFQILCGYPTAGSDALDQGLAEICARHAHVSIAD
ncbi:MAG: putative diguanylate cyclase [Nocardioidaceae bacterium]|jgi:diguanylate cyclase (GGDEF)-like protein|nr:putative diguanylate cyclase [Nocardioidaceae bacterium]